ncbi:acyltransferase family protein [Halobacillus trueperi]|uniref:acyltransferase family protein n=1 Tax=Halobacillus trueperi TaxID=156205 RepID=UPI003736DC14
MQNGIVKEIFLLRGIACLAVVCIHAISSVFMHYGFRKDPDYMTINNILFVIQILLMFGTPLFVFISEFVLSHSYKKDLPNGFFKKRIKYILFPYIFVGIVSCVIVAINKNAFTFSQLWEIMYEQFLLGYFHGYFVLIIFQFYVLHIFFKKYIQNKFAAKKVILSSIIINLIYLFYYNFIIPAPKFPFHLMFVAWISYFTIAFYCGINYEKFKSIITSKNKIIFLAPLFTGGIVLLMCVTGWLTYIQSKRVDIIFYTIAIAFLLFYIGNKMPKIPTFIVKISQYSYGIYLLHPFFHLILNEFFNSSFSMVNIFVYISIAILMGVIGPALIVKLLNKYRYGAILVGKVGIGLVDNRPGKLMHKRHLEKKTV